ncbi:MAG: AmmeMemoRadiSam system radical SAM enzyme, partial [Candidatus Aenigmarchaeota archaeon]|nr:AmmeMemoRadiSam system radical SAM enzyme [Candidatus Aenigmarchaeota archaeon]
EITDLLVTQIGDSIEKVKQLVEWVKENLGDETPIHFLRFFPHFRLTNLPPTPLTKLEKAYEVAKQIGMKYVYVGNVEGEKNNTYCPNCGRLLIKRYWMQTLEFNIKNGRCKFCGEKINIRGEKWVPKNLKS